MSSQFNRKVQNYHFNNNFVVEWIRQQPSKPGISSSNPVGSRNIGANMEETSGRNFENTNKEDKVRKWLGGWGKKILKNKTVL